MERKSEREAVDIIRYKRVVNRTITFAKDNRLMKVTWSWTGADMFQKDLDGTSRPV